MYRRWIAIAMMAWISVSTLVSLLLVPAPALATGEAYSFSKANTIQCSGGDCASPTQNTLNLTGGPTTFTGSYNVVSGNIKTGQSVCTYTVTVTLGSKATGGGYNATVKGSSAAGCGALKLDSPVVVGDPNKVGPNGGNQTTTGTQAATQDKPQCYAGPAITWLLCDIIIEPMLGLIDWIRQSIIAPFLKTDVLGQKTTTYTYDKAGVATPHQIDSPAYSIWQAFRNLASIAFILIFFLVIFGTALGFDNYTVKKILPRLVIGAVLIPLSWYICIVVIDIGNVLGQGVLGLANSVPAIANAQVNFGSSVEAILLTGAGAILTVAAVQGVITSFIPTILVTMLLAFLTVFFTLMLRKILIILAVVLSPIALLLWILPNTNKWFKMWWENFLKLILMYPAAMLLFVAGQIFAVVAGAIPAGDKFGQFTAPLFELAGLVLPLFLIPFTFKAGGKMLSLGQGAIGKAAGFADKRYGKDSQMGKDQLANKERKGAIGAQTALARAEKAGNAFARRRALAAAGFHRMRSGHTGFVGTRGGDLTQLRMEEALDKATKTSGKIKNMKEARGEGDASKKLPTVSGDELVNLEAEAAMSHRIAEHAELEAHGITQKRLNQRAADRLHQQTEAGASSTLKKRQDEAGFRKVYETEKNTDGSIKRNADGSKVYKTRINAEGKEERIFKGYVNNMSPSDAKDELLEDTDIELKKLKASGGKEGNMDIIGANMASMGRSGSGALADQELLNKYFGRNRDRTVDPAALGDYTQSLLDAGLSQVDKKKHPTLFQPASVAEEGVSASDQRAMHYRGKEVHYVDVTSPDIPQGERVARISETAKGLAQARANRNNWSEWNDQDKAVVMRFIDSEDPTIRADTERELRAALAASGSNAPSYDDFVAEIKDSAQKALDSGTFSYKAVPTPAAMLDPADPTGKTTLKDADGNTLYKNYQDKTAAPEWYGSDGKVKLPPSLRTP